eukprot:TRINITY_DN2192_c0_g1_i1.p1 TRINITY_DN2192_c0_g1~~TRINITY_DN2192_c0_g1_i1.p1  ORF type:complete len:102 (+),score=9.30 TRINITY_DN2192_c0_g1_i1:203-508(+)
MIAKRVGVRGYGPLIGACVGNIAADGIAALPEGSHAALGVVTGTALPLTPLLWMLVRRRELTRRTTISFCIFAGVAVTFGFLGNHIYSLYNQFKEYRSKKL